MCGRINMGLDPADLVDELDIDVVTYAHHERYNVPPGGVLPIIIDRPDEDGAVIRRLEPARWGLVPGWAKDLKIGFRAFNARSETARSKPMFRAAFARQRAVLPIPAYYEWLTDKSGKRPWMMRPAQDQFLLMAGMFELRRLSEEEQAAAGDDPAAATGWLVSTTILTAPAAGHLAEVHDRMPVMLRPDDVGDWLAPERGGGQAEESVARLLEQFDPATVDRHRVGTEVGNVRNDGPHLAEPVSDE